MTRPPTSPPQPSAPWARAAEQLAGDLTVDLERGLAADEVARRLELHGPNRLRCAAGRGAWSILVHQFASPLVALLAVAAAVALALGEQVEGVAVLVVILLNAGIGFATEQRAVRSMEALRRLGAVRTLVRRDGRQQLVPADDLVPGDLVVLDAGDVLTADLRLLSGSRLSADESALTGESVPVAKGPEPVAPDAALPDRTCMLHRGTALTRGAGLGLVVATGMATELGRISALVEGAVPEATPLERRLDLLARRLIRLTVVVAALVGVAILSTGRGVYLAVETGIALAVATIPEGLPIVATLALARGMWRMARRNALIENLASVETLGSTTVILTDKTGTLTENRMTAVELRLPGAQVEVGGTGLETSGVFTSGGAEAAPEELEGLAEALRAGVLCSNAGLEVGTDGAPCSTGDPTEVALLVAGAKAGLDRTALLTELPELHQEAFDPDRLRMATQHRTDAGVLTAVKGAPEAVVACCSAVGLAGEPLDEAGRAAWLAAAGELAERGQRVLGLAQAERPTADGPVYEGLTLLGLVGLQDPPRADVPAAVEGCRAAGIRLVMVTGDHGATGRAVAEAVGLVEPEVGEPFVDGRALGDLGDLDPAAVERLLAAPVIARATPEQKLDLIELHQRRGQVVAMTGDGVNDAPALKEADIGIAMGQRGTQVACEAADMVLQDDRLGTIVAAIGQGRAIFSNIRKFVVYLLSCNVSEILVVGLGVLLQGPLPLLPLQILFLNLVTDVFPALALGGCEGGPGLMRRPPRDPAEPILTRRHWRGVLSMGAVIALCTLAALTLALHPLGLPFVEGGEATTVAFLTLALAQLWLVFGMRAPGTSWLRNEVTRNPWVWAALALCVALLLLALYVPVLATALALTAPGPAGWAVALGLSLVPAAVALALPGGPRRAR